MSIDVEEATVHASASPIPPCPDFCGGWELMEKVTERLSGSCPSVVCSPDAPLLLGRSVRCTVGVAKPSHTVAAAPASAVARRGVTLRSVGPTKQWLPLHPFLCTPEQNALQLRTLELGSPEGLFIIESPVAPDGSQGIACPSRARIGAFSSYPVRLVLGSRAHFLVVGSSADDTCSGTRRLHAVSTATWEKMLQDADRRQHGEVNVVPDSATEEAIVMHCSDGQFHSQLYPHRQNASRKQRDFIMLMSSSRSAVIFPLPHTLYCSGSQQLSQEARESQVVSGSMKYLQLWRTRFDAAVIEHKCAVPNATRVPEGLIERLLRYVSTHTEVNPALLLRSAVESNSLVEFAENSEEVLYSSSFWDLDVEQKSIVVPQVMPAAASTLLRSAERNWAVCSVLVPRAISALNLCKLVLRSDLSSAPSQILESLRKVARISHELLVAPSARRSIASMSLLAAHCTPEEIAALSSSSNSAAKRQKRSSFSPPVFLSEALRRCFRMEALSLRQRNPATSHAACEEDEVEFDRLLDIPSEALVISDTHDWGVMTEAELRMLKPRSIRVTKKSTGVIEEVTQPSRVAALWSHHTATYREQIKIQQLCVSCSGAHSRFDYSRCPLFFKASLHGVPPPRCADRSVSTSTTPIPQDTPDGSVTLSLPTDVKKEIIASRAKENDASEERVMMSLRRRGTATSDIFGNILSQLEFGCPSAAPFLKSHSGHRGKGPSSNSLSLRMIQHENAEFKFPTPDAFYERVEEVVEAIVKKSNGKLREDGHAVLQFVWQQLENESLQLRLNADRHRGNPPPDQSTTATPAAGSTPRRITIGFKRPRDLTDDDVMNLLGQNVVRRTTELDEGGAQKCPICGIQVTGKAALHVHLQDCGS